MSGNAGNRPHRKARGGQKAEDGGVAALVECIQSISSRADGGDQDPSARPAKRAKTSRVWESICVAREQLTVTCAEPTHSRDVPGIECKSVGDVIAVQLRPSLPDGPSSGLWCLEITPRPKYRGTKFLVRPVLADASLTATLKAALAVAESQGFDPGEAGCLWATVDVSMRQFGDSVQLDLSLQVIWNERTSVWGTGRMNSPSQQALRDEVFRTWYPDLCLPAARGIQTAWSAQDFYQAACVPDKETLDAEVSSMEIERLGTPLYPFQRRAVQWLLRREGVQWRQSPQNGHGGGIEPYVPLASSDPPLSFKSAKDADGNTIFLSPLLAAATRDTALFRSVQDFRGGILAEEMGLGKTLEVIALILLHPRPPSPAMIFDSFLERELLATSATLIVAPTSLLDQWLSELNRHAPSLKVAFYPGIKRATKLNDSFEGSAEHLAEQDVVVTTYEVLRTEIWAASDEPARKMRNKKQYERRKSPLVQLSWWRVCIDEAQMVENWTNNSAKLARMIPRINGWGVTGTPVKDDIQKGRKRPSPPPTSPLPSLTRRPRSSRSACLSPIRALRLRLENMELSHDFRQGFVPQGVQLHIDAPQ